MNRTITASLLSLSLLCALLVGSTGVSAQTPAAKQPAQTSANPTAVNGVFETADEHGRKVSISTSNDSSGVSVVITSNGLPQTFKFTSEELSSLLRAAKSGTALNDANNSVKTRLKSFHETVKNSVDRKVMEKLANEINATGEFDVAAASPVGKSRVGFKMVAASAAVASCWDWAVLDYRMCMIDYDDDMLCIFSALLMYLSCDE